MKGEKLKRRNPKVDCPTHESKEQVDVAMSPWRPRRMKIRSIPPASGGLRLSDARRVAFRQQVCILLRLLVAQRLRGHAACSALWWAMMSPCRRVRVPGAAAAPSAARVFRASRYRQHSLDQPALCSAASRSRRNGRLLTMRFVALREV